MKTVAQMADENNVSVQTIYRLLNRVKQETNECLTEKINGVAHFTEKGEKLLQERLTGVKQMLNSVKQAESEEILFLREQVRLLLERLDVKDKQLEDERIHSRNLAAQLAELARNSQILQGAEQSRTNPALLMDNKAERTTVKERIKFLFTGKPQ